MDSAQEIRDLLTSGSTGDLARLREAGIIRGVTSKQVAGDYAEHLVKEHLVKEHLGGELVRRGNPGFDVLADCGRVSVKSRSLAVDYYKHFTVRQHAEPDFDVLVLVEFAPDWTVACARRMTWEDMPRIRDYRYAPPKGGEYSRFYRQGKWRTQATGLALEAPATDALPDTLSPSATDETQLDATAQVLEGPPVERAAPSRAARTASC